MHFPLSIYLLSDAYSIFFIYNIDVGSVNISSNTNNIIPLFCSHPEKVFNNFLLQTILLCPAVPVSVLPLSSISCTSFPSRLSQLSNFISSLSSSLSPLSNNLPLSLFYLLVLFPFSLLSIRIPVHTHTTYLLRFIYSSPFCFPIKFYSFIICSTPLFPSYFPTICIPVHTQLPLKIYSFIFFFSNQSLLLYLNFSFSFLFSVFFFLYLLTFIHHLVFPKLNLFYFYHFLQLPFSFN